MGHLTPFSLPWEWLSCWDNWERDSLGTGLPLGFVKLIHLQK
jgi:hypothetical protein